VYVEVLPLIGDFGEELATEVQGASDAALAANPAVFRGLTDEAKHAGDDIADDIGAGTLAAGAAVRDDAGNIGADLATGIAAGTVASEDVIRDSARTVGDDAAGALGVGLSGGMAGATADAEGAFRTGGAAIVTDAAGAGALAGAGLRGGIRDGVKGAADDAEKGGADIAEHLNNALASGLNAVGGLLSHLGLPLGGLGDKFKSTADSAGVFGGKLGAISAVGAATSIALVATAGVMVDMGDKFQQAVTAMAAAGDIPIKVANQIGSAFLKSGSDVIFSAQEQVAAYGQVAGQLSTLPGYVDNVANATGFMKAAMDLAEESGQKLGQTTSDLGGLMQSFQVPVKAVAGVTVDLENASRLTGSSVDSLANVMERLKARMGITAPTISDLSTLLVDLGEHGVTGSRGLLVVNTAMSTLLKSTTSLQDAEKTASTAYADKLAKAQDAVQTASLALAAAQDKVGSSATAAGDKSVLASQQAAAAAVLAADNVKKAQDTLAADQAKVVTTAAAEQAKQATIAQAQITLTEAQAKAATIASEATTKGAIASAAALSTQDTSTIAVQQAQLRLTQAQQSLNEVTTTAGSKLSATNQILASLGLHVYDAAGHFEGMGAVIGQLQPKLEHLTQQQQLADLAAVFGASANKALLTTVLAGPEAYEKAQKAVTDAAAAHHALAVQQQTLGHELEAMKVQLVDLATRVGVVLIPVLQVALHVVTDFLGFIMSHKEVLIAFAVVIGGTLAAAIAVFAVNAIGSLVESTEKAIGTLAKLSASPPRPPPPRPKRQPNRRPKRPPRPKPSGPRPRPSPRARPPSATPSPAPPPPPNAWWPYRSGCWSRCPNWPPPSTPPPGAAMPWRAASTGRPPAPTPPWAATPPWPTAWRRSRPPGPTWKSPSTWTP
jgi:hypothetical protein